MPILISANTYRATPNSTVVLRGHDLGGTTQATVGGVSVRVISADERSVTIAMPDIPVSGTVEISTPKGTAVLSRPMAPPDNLGSDHEEDDFDLATFLSQSQSKPTAPITATGFPEQSSNSIFSITAPPTPSNPASLRDEIAGAFGSMGDGIKSAGEARVAELVEKQGYIGFRKQSAAEAFRQGHPDWGNIVVNGETRFFPPGTKPKASFGPDKAPATPRPTLPPPAAPAPVIPPPSVLSPRLNASAIAAAVASQGYYGVRGQRAAKEFQRAYPDWQSLSVDGEMRFFPPGIEPSAAPTPEPEPIIDRPAPAHPSPSRAPQEAQGAPTPQTPPITPPSVPPAPAANPVAPPVTPSAAAPSPMPSDAPVLLTVAPVRVAIGQQAVLSGRNLRDTSSVTVGGVSARVVRSYGNFLIIEIPQGASSGTIEVTTPSGRARLSAQIDILPPLPGSSNESGGSPAPAPTPINNNGGAPGASSPTPGTQSPGGGPQPPTPPRPPSPPAPPAPPSPPSPNSPTPGPGNSAAPIVQSASRYSVVAGDTVRISGRNLRNPTSVTVGGVAVRVRASDTGYIYFDIPTPAIGGQVVVTNGAGSDALARPLTVAPPPSSPPTPPPPDPGGINGNSSDDDSFDWGAAVRSIGEMVPRSFRPIFTSAANVITAIQTARSSAPMAPNGDWYKYSVDNSSWSKWQEAKERQRRYEQRAATDPSNQHWADRARQAQQIAEQRGQAVAGSALAGGMTGAAIGVGMGQSGILSGIAGAAGTVFGGPAIGAIASVIAGLVEAAIKQAIETVKKTYANVAQGGNLGSQAVGDILGGVKSASREAYNVGVEFADAILNAIGAQLGEGGASVTRFIGQATRTTGRLLETVFDGGAALAKGAGRIGGAGIVAGGAAVGAGAYIGAGMLFGGVGGVGGLLLAPMLGIIGGLVGSTIGLLVMKVVSAVSSLVSQLIGTFAKLFGEIGGLAAGFLKTVLEVAEASRKALVEYSASAMSITNHSGMGMSQSQNLLLSRSAFGQSYSQTNAQYSSFSNMPLFSGAIKAAFGVKGETGSDEEFNSILNRAKSLPLMLRRVFLQNTVEGEDFWLKLISYPKEKVAAQLNFFKNFQLDNGTMKSAAEDLTLLQDRMSGWWQWLLRTIGSALLPILTVGMTRITNFLKANQGEIQNWVMGAIKWLYVEFPSYLGKAAVSVGTIIGKMANGIINGLGSLSKMVRPILGFFDSIINGARQMVISVLAALAALAAGPVAGPFVHWKTTQMLQAAIPTSNQQYGATANALIRNLNSAQATARQQLSPVLRMANGMNQWGTGLQNNQANRDKELADIWKDIRNNTSIIADAAKGTEQGVAELGPIISEEIVHGSVRRASRALARRGF